MQNNRDLLQQHNNQHENNLQENNQQDEESETDEEEMGIKYVDLDRYIRTQEGSLATKEKVDRVKKITEHKRNMGRIYPN